MEKLKKIQEDTLLGLVNKIFEAGEFPCPAEVENDEVGPNETVISEATDYEKAILLTAKQVGAEYNKDLYRAYQDGDINPIKLCHLAKTNITLSNLFWESMRKRLGEPALKTNTIGIRKSWKIVSFNEETNDPMLDALIAITKGKLML